MEEEEDVDADHKKELPTFNYINFKANASRVKQLRVAKMPEGDILVTISSDG